jgi:hypothetical protein
MKKKKKSEARAGIRVEAPAEARPIFQPWWIAAAGILLASIVRLRLLGFPLERDEGEYAYAGRLILQGIPPYKLAYNMKLPGVYGAYALLMGVFGQSPEGIHLGLLLVNVGAIVLVYFLGKRLFGAPAGAVAAASYALLSIGEGVLGLAAHATHFVVLAALGGTLLLLKALDSGRSSVVFWSGLLYGLAFIMKQQGVFFGVFGASYLLWSLWRKNPAAWMGNLKKFAIFMAGAALPFGLTCLILWRVGVFDKFWFWTFTYARQYASEVPFADWGRNLSEDAPAAVEQNLVIWLLAGAGLFWAFWKKQTRPSAIFVAGLLAASLAAFSVGGFFRSHYLIPMLAVVALLAGALVGSPRTILRSVAFWLFVAAFGYSVYQQRAAFFTLTPVELCQETYTINPFSQAAEIAAYIRDHTKKTDRIAVLGSEPEIYFLADRHSATGYIYTYPAVEPQPYAATMQKEMIGDIESARPPYVVLVGVNTSWVAKKEAPTLLLDWMFKYLDRYYDTVGVADILSPQQTVYVWDAAAAAYQPRSRFFVKVFRRR